MTHPTSDIITHPTSDRFTKAEAMPVKYQYEVEEYATFDLMRAGLKFYGKEGWRAISIHYTASITIVFERIA